MDKHFHRFSEEGLVSIERDFPADNTEEGARPQVRCDRCINTAYTNMLAFPVAEETRKEFLEWQSGILRTYSNRQSWESNGRLERVDDPKSAINLNSAAWRAVLSASEPRRRRRDL